MKEKINNLIEDVGEVIEEADKLAEAAEDVVEAAAEVSKEVGGILTSIKNGIQRLIDFIKGLFNRKG